MKINIGIEEKDREIIAKGLARLLADSYTLYLKTHNFHWNVTGPMFQTLHLMFETQYSELALAVDMIAERTRRIVVGPSLDPASEMGPLVTRQHRDKVMGYVDQGVKEGAKLVVDGRGLKLQGYENGNFMGGCLFDDVKPDMTIYKDEIFGPVLSVVLERMRYANGPWGSRLEALNADLSATRQAAMALSAEELRPLAGVYALNPRFKLTVRADGSRLFAQATGQG